MRNINNATNDADMINQDMPMPLAQHLQTPVKNAVAAPYFPALPFMNEVMEMQHRQFMECGMFNEYAANGANFGNESNPIMAISSYEQFNMDNRLVHVD